MEENPPTHPPLHGEGGMLESSTALAREFWLSAAGVGDLENFLQGTINGVPP